MRARRSIAAAVAAVACVCPAAAANAASDDPGTEGGVAQHEPEEAQAAARGIEPSEIQLGLFHPGDITDPRPFADNQELIRRGVYWNAVQPTCRAIRKGRYDWRYLDGSMRPYLEAGDPLLLTVREPPECASIPLELRPGQPKRPYWNDYTRFIRELIKRYGRDSRLAERYGSRGIKRIEVWNEPNSGSSWKRPDPADYARFLAFTSKRIRGATDRNGIVIHNGGLAASDAVEFLRGLYKRGGIKRSFDELSIHTYSPNPQAVLKIVTEARRVMRRNGDHAPIAITEHAWATCADPSPDRNRGKCTTPQGQAEMLAELVPLLESRTALRVSRFIYFTPQDYNKPSMRNRCPREPKYQYGFFDVGGQAKPAWAVWQALTGATGPTERSPVPRRYRIGCP